MIRFAALLKTFANDTMTSRHERLAELRAQLSELNARGRATEHGSPEMFAVLAEWAPVHVAVLALADELEDLPREGPQTP
ncbi:hypothetical protein [Synechococcus sp. CBW1006]|uniref:hypothetical protein n=1 Tax=Synechococcus sp. CBW1006 TaxID=1353138 RepID=UPI0018CC92DC|nr:hypothetical protein [Synechococcus sp. CBW1006]QPN68097.1 hypothetical protein H8F26_08470 [Synechococcus sp. CBW1006]